MNCLFLRFYFSENGVEGGNYQPGDILKQVDVPKEENELTAKAEEEEVAEAKEEISPIEYEFGVT